jgi:uncharacterized protein (DUF1697 family)
MNQYIAFLRGINLGNRRIKMDELRGLFEAMKFSEVSTYIASGNVILESSLKDSAKVESHIERELAKSLGYEVDTFVRTRAEVAAAAAARPFSAQDMANPAYTVNVGLFKVPLESDLVRKFEAIQTEVDEFRVIGRDYYWLCRIKMSDSKVWSLPQVRTLRFPSSSMRNLKTLRHLAELFPPDRTNSVVSTVQRQSKKPTR